MASKFYIEVEIPEITTLPPKVRMVDDDQNENTAWVKVDLAFRKQPAEVIFAAALLESQEIQEMVEVAKQVAYAVWINDDTYDIHTVTPALARAMVEQAKMDEATSKASPMAEPRRRM